VLILTIFFRTDENRIPAKHWNVFERQPD